MTEDRPAGQFVGEGTGQRTSHDAESLRFAGAAGEHEFHLRAIARILPGLLIPMSSTRRDRLELLLAPIRLLGTSIPPSA